MRKHLESLEKKIGIPFKDKKFLENVFVHRSYLNEHKDFHSPSNEKLEFLGDSVLSLVTSGYLYHTYPRFAEGEYTDIKSAIVRTESLATAARKLGLGDYLYLSRGEDKSGGRDNKNILADCFEALIAAIFLDQGYPAAEQFIKKYLFSDVLHALITKKKYVSAKTQLQEVVQLQHKMTPVYRVLEEEGPEHKRIFTVGVYIKKELVATAVGASKKEAEEAAAAGALDKMVSV
jgi:ribonuclease-3